MILLQCITKILEMFNMYAFVQVAVDGKSYCESAVDTLRLAKEVGLDAVINDDVVSGVMGTGKWIGSYCLMALGGVIAYHEAMPIGLVATMMVVGFAFGFVIMDMATVVVEISAATLFICFAKDPHALKNSHPDLYDALVKAWEKKGGGPLPGGKAAPSSASGTPVVGSPVTGTGATGKTGAVAVAGAGAAVAVGSEETKEENEVNLRKVNQSFLELVNSKPQLRKYPQSGNRGMSYVRTIVVDTEKGTFAWKSNDPKSIVFLGDVTKITPGAQTDYLREHVKAENHSKCFTIFTDKREINLEADNEEQAKLWVKGLQSLVKSVYKAKGGAGGGGNSSKCLIM